MTKAHFTVRTCPTCGQPVNSRNDAIRFFDGEDEGGEEVAERTI